MKNLVIVLYDSSFTNGVSLLIICRVIPMKSINCYANALYDSLARERVTLITICRAIQD